MRGATRTRLLGISTALAACLVAAKSPCGAAAARPGPEAPRRPAPAVERNVRATLASLPLAFEANRGQCDPAVRFLHRAPGYTLFLAPAEAVFALGGRGERTSVLRMRLEGAAPGAVVTGEAPQAGRSHFLRGSDPGAWTRDVGRFSRVRSAGVYPGIDVVYHGSEGMLEYDFVLRPGADPAAIGLRFEGADSMTIDAAGDLLLVTPGGTVRQHAPRLYQEIDGARRAVPGRYAVRGDGLVGFEAPDYDRARTLVIDPTLVYGTYLGGNDRDIPYGIAMDAAGNVYVTGDTFSSDFPAVSFVQDSFQGVGNGGYYGTYYVSGDAFVTKLDATGTSVVYSTYLGGSADDVGFGIAVDAAGSATVTGRTFSTDFPTTPGAFDGGSGGGFDAFVAKLAPDGASLEYSTYLGGGGQDEGFAVAVDGDGSAYVTGSSWSVDFPVEGQIPSVHVHAYNSIFVTKLSADGSALAYSSLVGGNGNYDLGFAIAVDSSGRAVVAGQTSSTDFPMIAALQGTKASTYDAFLLRVNAAGTALDYCTYLGGGAWDICYALALDAAGNAYLAGHTDSPDFPTTAGAFQETTSTPGNGGNAWVTKVAADGSALVYSTYLEDASGYLTRATGIAVDGAGNAFVTGFTGADTHPLVNPIVSAKEGNEAAFLTKFNAAGSALVYSTLVGFGGSYQFATRVGPFVAVDAAGVAVVAGNTTSTTWAGSPGAFQETAPPGVNGFVVKIHPLMVPASPSGLEAAATSPHQVEITWTDESDEESAYEVERSVEGGAFSPLATLAAGASSHVDAGRDPMRTYAYRVRATNGVGPSPYAVSGDATTPGTLDVAAGKGRLRDSVEPDGDSLKVKGALAFNGQAADQAFDPAADGLEVAFGDPSDPYVLVVPAGDPGWKSKNNKFTWKSPRGSLPKVKLVLDFAKGSVSLSAKGFDLPAAPAGDVRLFLRSGNDAGGEDAGWTPHPKTAGIFLHVP